MFRKQSLHLFISSAVNFVIMAFIIYNDYQDNLMDICRGVTAGSGNFLLFSIFLHKKKNLQLKMIRALVFYISYLDVTLLFLQILKNHHLLFLEFLLHAFFPT